MQELPDGFHSHGIDISHYQGEIDWSSFTHKTDSLISFVFCKATEGLSFVDPRWSVNRNALRENNIRLGAYHYFLPKKNAKAQAKHYLNNFTPKQHDLPPVIDIEEEGISDDDLIKRMKIWLTYVEDKTGRRPIIYTSYSFYNSKFRGQFKGYKFWIANYTFKPERMVEDDILYWQYTDEGRIPGIYGNVDLNFSKVQF